MFEFGIENFQSINNFNGMKKTIGSKPMLLFLGIQYYQLIIILLYYLILFYTLYFLGIQWESDSLYKRISNFLMDFFRGIKFDMICLKGIDHILSFTVVDGKIYMRGYAVSFRKSGTKVCLTLLHTYVHICYSIYRNKSCYFIHIHTHIYAYTY